MTSAQPLIRGCGTRQRGGIYSTLTVGPDGLPVEYFLYDPPQPIDPEALGVSPVGVSLIEQHGVYHILDWIGSAHYPNVADFIEEVARYGLSRRLSSRLEFEKLTPESRHIAIHARGSIVNHEEFQAMRAARSAAWLTSLEQEHPPVRCPKQYVSRHRHVPAADRLTAEATATRHGALPLDVEVPDGAVTQECAALWWEVVGGGLPSDAGSRLRHRQLPSLQYTAWGSPYGVEPEFRPALVARFPIGHLAVIRDPGDPAREQAACTAAARSTIPVQLEEE